ncbi:MAG: hypothetical protein LBS64_06175 [Spirochaetaceae bacterium]|jgi:hypothetical protein|nr:hypothetical protein [Spirochaetaceae bacterium]
MDLSHPVPTHPRLRQTLIVFAAVVCFTASFLVFRLTRPGTRCMFYFPSLDDGRLCSEVRFLPQKPPQGNIRFFVDELLLGPLTYRYGMLFSQGTRVGICVLEGGVLYLGLSLPSLFPQGTACPFEQSVELLEKNIRSNFPAVKSIKLLLNGKEVLWRLESARQG